MNIRIIAVISSLIISVISCNSSTLHKQEDYGKDVVYAENGNFGETQAAKDKRIKRETALAKNTPSIEEKEISTVRHIQQDLSILSYEIGNSNGILDDKTISAIKLFKSEYSISSTELISEELEEKLSSEAWEIKKYNLEEDRLSLKKNSESRWLDICLMDLKNIPNDQLNDLKTFPYSKSKASVYIYREPDKNKTYPTTRVYINNKTINNFKQGSYTHIYLEPGTYLFEERRGFSLDISSRKTTRPITLDLKSNVIYYIHLSLNHSAEVNPGYFGFYIEGIFIEFNGDASLDKYSSSFIVEGKALGECIMKKGTYFEGLLK